MCFGILCAKKIHSCQDPSLGSEKKPVNSLDRSLQFFVLQRQGDPCVVFSDRKCPMVPCKHPNGWVGLVNLEVFSGSDVLDILSKTLPETKIFAPENGWLVQMSFLLGPGNFSGVNSLLFSGSVPPLKADDGRHFVC